MAEVYVSDLSFMDRISEKCPDADPQTLSTLHSSFMQTRVARQPPLAEAHGKVIKAFPAIFPVNKEIPEDAKSPLCRN